MPHRQWCGLDTCEAALRVVSPPAAGPWPSGLRSVLPRVLTQAPPHSCPSSLPPPTSGPLCGADSCPPQGCSPLCVVLGLGSLRTGRTRWGRLAALSHIKSLDLSSSKRRFCYQRFFAEEDMEDRNGLNVDKDKDRAADQASSPAGTHTEHGRRGRHAAERP